MRNLGSKKTKGVTIITCNNSIVFLNSKKYPGSLSTYFHDTTNIGIVAKFCIIQAFS